jgi:hypothetical protein
MNRDYGMHVFDTKYREEFRKVTYQSSLRENHEKVQNRYSFLQFSRGIFLTTNHKSWHLYKESTVDFTLLLAYKFLLQNAYFI